MSVIKHILYGPLPAWAAGIRNGLYHGAIWLVLTAVVTLIQAPEFLEWLGEQGELGAVIIFLLRSAEGFLKEFKQAFRPTVGS